MRFNLIEIHLCKPLQNFFFAVLIICLRIQRELLKTGVPSRLEEYHLQPLTDSVREPLDSYGSCRPSLQNLSTLELRNKPKLLSFPIDLGSQQADTSPSLHPHYRDFNNTKGGSDSCTGIGTFPLRL